MSDPPPPSDPPPGWYPDPAEEPGYRWWDGQAWTETVTADVDTAVYPAYPASASAKTGPLGPVSPWFSESFRMLLQRSGHFLPMILLFVLSLSIPTSFGVWYALRDTVITFDPTTAAPEVSYGGSRPWLYAVLVLFPLSTVLSYLAKGSVIRQAWAAQAGQPESWSDSVTGCLRRARRVIPASLGRSLLYWGLNGLFLVAVVLTPVAILLLPLLLMALFVIWVRFSFVGTFAVLGEDTDGPFRSSWALSSGHFLALAGRLILLAVVAINLVVLAGFIGAPFAAIVGGTGSGVEPTAETLRFNEVLGPNAAIFAFGSVFNAIGLGANYILSAVGTTLLYRNLDGPVGGLSRGQGERSSVDGGSGSEHATEG